MRRGIVVGAVAVAMAAAIPMQAAVGAKPYRDPIRGGVGPGVNAQAGSFTRFFPASKTEGCEFAESVVVQVGGILWQFSTGVEAEHNVATQTITNVASGTTFVHRSDYRRTITYLANGTQLYEIDGNFWISFVQGDQGPYGTVGPGGR